MKAPLTWLNDYVDISDIAPKDFNDKMTMSGSKVEIMEYMGGDIENVVVGKILQIEKHPDADKLDVCQVDVGKGEPVQIVTGAKNIAAGDCIPVALDGAKLPGGVEIKKTKMRGVVSNGMLCSHQELGLTLGDVPYGHEHGILVFPEEHPPGSDAKKIFGLDEYVAEFEITSNRPDCLSIIGLAREASATFGKHLILPEIYCVEEDQSDDVTNYLSVTVEAPELCPRYCARVVKEVKIGPSPDWMRNYLRNAGVRPINNIVDITNFVMLEYGQPLHAFDHKHLNGQKIIVRTARENEHITTLDGQDRKLDPSMLVICDEKAPVAVAGVMGGEFSGIYDDTTTIVIESANFFGPSVRITSKNLGLRTEASGRFEKGLDPHISPIAADRACQLIEMLGAGKVVKGAVDANHIHAGTKQMPLRADYINQFLGIRMPAQEMCDILENLDFDVDENLMITVPTFRADIESDADIAEEIARFYGYDRIPTTLLFGETTQGIWSEEQKAQKRVHFTLLSQGLSEVITSSFVSPKAFDKIRLPQESPLRTCVKISNPLGEDTSLMRTSMLPSIMDVFSRNYNFRNPSCDIYEIGTVYLPDSDSSKLPDEKKIISLGFYHDGDYYRLKGICEELLKSFGICDYTVEPKKDDPSFHPGRCAVVSVNGRKMATLGQIHPAVCRNYDIEKEVYAAFIDFALLLESASFEKTYTPLPKFPSVLRDLALVCDIPLPVAKIESCIKEQAGKLLEKLTLFDVYTGNQIGENKKSVAYSLILRDNSKTLNDKEIEEVLSRVLSTLKSTLDVSLRK